MIQPDSVLNCQPAQGLASLALSARSGSSDDIDSSRNVQNALNTIVSICLVVFKTCKTQASTVTFANARCRLCTCRDHTTNQDCRSRHPRIICTVCARIGDSFAEPLHPAAARILTAVAVGRRRLCKFSQVHQQSALLGCWLECAITRRCETRVAAARGCSIIACEKATVKVNQWRLCAKCSLATSEYCKQHVEMEELLRYDRVMPIVSWFSSCC